MGKKAVTSHYTISQRREQTSESLNDPLRVSQWEVALGVGPRSFPSGSHGPGSPWSSGRTASFLHANSCTYFRHTLTPSDISPMSHPPASSSLFSKMIHNSIVIYNNIYRYNTHCIYMTFHKSNPVCENPSIEHLQPSPPSDQCPSSASHHPAAAPSFCTQHHAGHTADTHGCLLNVESALFSFWSSAPLVSCESSACFLLPWCLPFLTLPQTPSISRISPGLLFLVLAQHSTVCSVCSALGGWLESLSRGHTEVCETAGEEAGTPPSPLLRTLGFGVCDTP